MFTITTSISHIKKSDTIKAITKNKYLYIMILPVLLHYIIFKYFPMYGIIIAFKDFKASLGIIGSPWVGFVHFQEFFSSYYFYRLIRNTILLNIYQLIFAFPAPIILALLLNEVHKVKFKKFVQTVSYLPHFISIVVVVGFMVDFFASDGVINNMLFHFGIKNIQFMLEPKWFRTLYVGSDIWQGIGWGSIIYLSAISGIDQEMYEAATIDGATRMQKIWKITIPCIMPTIIILLIFKIGGFLDIGFEKVFLMYKPSTYETADVISTFIYRRGLEGAQYSYAAAVGLFNALIAFIFLASANYISRHFSETSLW